MIPKLYYRFRRKLCSIQSDARGVEKWSHLMASEAVLPVLRNSFEEQVHPMVHVEISTNCNNRCPFCAQSYFRRPVKYISRLNFDRLLVELKSIDYSGSVVLNVNNEPFLHPDLLWFCERICEELPRADYGFNTNGVLITPEHIERFTRLRRKPLIVLNDYTADHAIALRVEKWLSDAKQQDMRFTVIRRSLDEKLSNSAGNINADRSYPEDCRDVVCTWPFTGICVDTDLRVFLCCFDYMHEIILGNLADRKLMDIWCSDSMRQIRHRMLETKRKNLPLCCKCDVDWVHLPKYCA